MTERKKFPCPGCGVDSWLDTDSLKIEHGEPTCEGWRAAQAPQTVGATITGTGVPFRQKPPPLLVEFDCPECKAPVRMLPREQPIAVQHAIPSCEAWAKVEGKRDDLERYLIKAGVHIYVPNRD